MRNLIPEVAEFFRIGRLNEFDAEWIARLKPESQLAAAKKCMAANPTFTPDRYDRSTIGTRPGKSK